MPREGRALLKEEEERQKAEGEQRLRLEEVAGEEL
jgi:hypothetical protein